MKPSIWSMLLVTGMAATTVSPAKAQVKCDALLPYVQDYESIRMSDYAKLVFVSDLARKTASEARSSFNVGGDIPYGDVILGAKMSDETFNKFKEYIRNHIDLEKVRLYQSEILRVQPNPKALDAWNKCIADHHGLALELVLTEKGVSQGSADRFGADQDVFTLIVHYRSGPLGAVGAHISSIDPGPGVTINKKYNPDHMPTEKARAAKPIMANGNVPFQLSRSSRTTPIKVTVAVMPKPSLDSEVGGPATATIELPVLFTPPKQEPPVRLIDRPTPTNEVKDTSPFAYRADFPFSFWLKPHKHGVYVLPRQDQNVFHPQITFDLGGKFKKLTTSAGITSYTEPDCLSQPDRTRVGFKFLGDGMPIKLDRITDEYVWVSPSQEGIALEIPVTGVKRLTIVGAAAGKDSKWCADGALGSAMLE
ncbi:MAG: NPCBM/NEW2 domain-containing protein [Reyranella sp.]|jgi:hypothetical protein|nr:NPCBM/NEW2 domain-containing protein [Reyranella sp.]